MLVLLALFFPSGIFSQTELPHVSDLRAEVRNNLIRLTWTDSPEAQGPVFIYRSDSPFNTVNPIQGRLWPMEVPYGAESYIDETESSGWVYYFVAPSNDSQGEDQRDPVVYNTAVMPAGNTTAVRAIFEGPALPIVPAAEPDPVRSEILISGLRTVIDGEGVIVSYQVRDSSQDTVLYRSVQPIQGTEDLLRAVIVQSGLTSSFIDYPVPGIAYYYAVVFEDELPRGAAKIVPGANATTEAVMIRSRSGRVGLPQANTELRSMPLPLMSLNYAVPGMDSFSELSALIPLGKTAAQALSSTPRREPKIAAPQKPRAFSEDLNEKDNELWEGQDLKAIVQGPFLQQDWKTTITRLRSYLTLPRSGPTEARARFYLGQCLYFSADYREALVEFLMVKSEFLDEANKWIGATLTALVNER
ncbi:hypothetical protein FACS189450_01360 [Spirochaetia bacterium]|nr:hypothetical protein FACS189450_01360 [Spirochaetia bacterium]